MDSHVFLILTLLVLAEADFGQPGPTIPQRSLRDIVNKRRQLNYLKGLLQDLDDKLEKMESQNPSNAIYGIQENAQDSYQQEKRSCPINIPGMDCDYGEVYGVGKDHDFWKSRMAPGKRRRYRRALQYLL